MPKPNVACVMLVDGRPEMTRRAIHSFDAQTYRDSFLVILDTGAEPLPGGEGPLYVYEPHMHGGASGVSFGALRNRANTWALDLFTRQHMHCDIIAHFDSDDYSDSRRIE